MSLAGSCFSPESALRPFHYGSEDEAKPSLGRACRQIAGRSERTCDLTSSVVPRGTPFHRAVQLEFPPIGFDASRLSCGRSLSGPSEFGAVEPDAVDDHGDRKSTRLNSSH